MLQDRFEMDQASLASIHESKTLAGIFQHIVDDCRVIKKIEMMILAEIKGALRVHSIIRK